jgi:hypothetical protein
VVSGTVYLCPIEAKGGRGVLWLSGTAQDIVIPEAYPFQPVKMKFITGRFTDVAYRKVYRELPSPCVLWSRMPF